jgi:hypothetical protein
MLPKPKPIDQKTDEELAHDLQTATKRDSWLYRNSRHVNHAAAIVIFAAGYFTAKAMITSGLAMAGAAGMPLVLGGIVAGPAIWALGMVGCAIGWDRIMTRLSNVFRGQASDIKKEQDTRAFKKTPAYQELLRQAKEEAIRVKEALKKAFNAAVDKAFHGGTENKVTVKKPLSFKKPGEKPKKKWFSR